jgi:hypothetical protein
MISLHVRQAISDSPERTAMTLATGSRAHQRMVEAAT